MANTLNFIAASSELENEDRIACSKLQQMLRGSGYGHKKAQKSTTSSNTFCVFWAFLWLFTSFRASQNAGSFRNLLDNAIQRQNSTSWGRRCAAHSSGPDSIREEYGGPEGRLPRRWGPQVLRAGRFAPGLGHALSIRNRPRSVGSYHDHLRTQPPDSDDSDGQTAAQRERTDFLSLV